MFVELMARMGHDSERAALVYLHSSRERQRALADAVGEAARAELAESKRTKKAPPRARGGHRPRLSMRTTGAALLAVERCALNAPVAVLRWCCRGIYGRATVNSGSGCGTCGQQRD